MCGIAGIVGLNGYRPERHALEAMAEALRHRGPDDEGFYLHGPVGFGFRRLSILDLTPEGHQPMLSPDGMLAVVFNGEIYNYVELREELRALGYRFRSSGDTEVLLAAYREWGAACLERFNGMWAFIIHDRRTSTVFGARDRFGVKPLYVHRSPQAIVLASEIKAIRRSGLYRPAVNWLTAARYLVQQRLDDGLETFFAGVEAIPAGSSFTIDPAGEMKVRSFWNLPLEAAPAPGGAPARFADLFEDSVRLRLRSDVPVGVCLSGGLDSTSIICAMARQREAAGQTAHSLLAFSFNADEFDESRYLSATIAQTGATLVPLQNSGRDFWDLFTQVLAAQDEPVHSMTAVVLYALMGLARQHGVTVILDGDGADETIAGYSSHFRDYWHTLLRQGGVREAFREVAAFADGHGENRRKHLRSLLQHATLFWMSRLGLYGLAAQRVRRHSLVRHDWFQPEFAAPLANGWRRSQGTLNEVLVQSVISFPLPLYLRVLDRNSMAHSVEARVPFLDYRLVSLLFSLPAELKMRGPLNKYILREAMRGRIPEVVRSRVDKFGFPTPARTWVTGSLFEPIRDLLASQSARERGIYRLDRILSDLDRVRRGEADLAARLVCVAQFELWSELLGGGGTSAEFAVRRA